MSETYRRRLLAYYQGMTSKHLTLSKSEQESLSRWQEGSYWGLAAGPDELNAAGPYPYRV